ncbi:MAG: universal stress protein [Methylotenera sp.]|nr:universal stress protein [Methylotenera sp.]MDP1754871.1 universal stress protein [Methylotenera sp.]MDP1958186.1 universal stress protein [Methylotenera sp.]MDP3206771.1 universal stress protein [Methylotenera sp.]MDP3303223.1 universal stress protein [Methylotenera sp.]
MKHIFVATDFSKTAAFAVQRAAMLAAEHGAELTLLHVVSNSALARLRQLLLQDSAPTDADLLASFEAELQQIADNLGKIHNIIVHSRLITGNPHDDIARVTNEARADLMVVGAAGTALRQFFLGATAVAIISEAQQPVLVIRQAPQTPYQRVMAALDLSPASSDVVGLACRVAPQADLILAHAFTVEFESKLRYIGATEQDIQQYRQDARNHAQSQMQILAYSLPAETMTTYRLEHGFPEDILPALVQEVGANLLVVGKHDTSEVEELLLGSVTRHLLFEVTCDVLVLPASLKT